MNPRAPASRHAARARPGRGQRGFTLIELVFSAALLGLLAHVALLMWVDGFNLVRVVDGDSAALADARAALERMAREIREVKYDGASQAYCVSTMAATRMVFNKTVGGHAPGCGGSAPAADHNDIAVTIVGRNPFDTNQPSLAYAGALATPALRSELTSHATTFQLRYLDANRAATALPSALRFVQLDVTVQAPNAQATQVRTVVALRNH